MGTVLLTLTYLSIIIVAMVTLRHLDSHYDR